MTKGAVKSLVAALIIFLIVWLLAGCAMIREKRDYNQAKKAWKKIERMAKNHPGLVDSLTIVIRDTIRSTEVNEKLVFERVIDEAKVDSLAKVLCAALSDNIGKPPGLGKLRSLLSTSGCPEVLKDTTIFIRVFSSRDTTNLPIELTIKSQGERLEIYLSARSIKLPDEKTHTTVAFNEPEKSPLFNQWFWAWVVTVVIFLLMIIWTLRRR